MTESARRREEDRLHVEEIVLGDLSRQLDDNSQRQANMITRVSIAIAANGVALVPLFADGVASLRSWPGCLWLIPLLPAVLSIAFGFKAIDLWKSKASESTPKEVDAFRSAELKHVLDRLILDRLEVLEAARSDLKTKSKWHRRSVMTLACTGGTMVVVFIATIILGGQ